MRMLELGSKSSETNIFQGNVNSCDGIIWNDMKVMKID